MRKWGSKESGKGSLKGTYLYIWSGLKESFSTGYYKPVK